MKGAFKEIMSIYRIVLEVLNNVTQRDFRDDLVSEECQQSMIP